MSPFYDEMKDRLTPKDFDPVDWDEEEEDDDDDDEDYDDEEDEDE
jgi:hypothetical protein